MKFTQKIISLIPSVTEILYYLGLEAKVVGITENCNYPEETKFKCKVGTFGHPRLSAILGLEPDIVLADGALHKKLIEDLQRNKIIVIEATPINVNDIFILMSKLGSLSHTELTVQPLINRLRERVDRLIRKSVVRRPRVFRLMSTDPLVTPGLQSFQYDALLLAGAQLMDFRANDPYVKVSWDQVRRFDPEVILFCGVEQGQSLPLKCKGCIAKNPICHRTVEDILDLEWEHITAFRENRIYPVSCDTICRPGPRLIDGVEKLHNLFYRK
ncbi:ABC transporter substrate-binding protein [Desulfosporosinus youngiae]|uniref:ABC-type Fe3+-hydroxamate transport system, periplasmic component n=1 Tax=Desulfosporosinus youngiae DSM 17734 TaxID=768710 RepID=H5XTC7_9FIRM|nr:helical backbone metal receptor [Desulfosporosinus youngiae]EHQ88386.1 ABC-type Fe3+-hydroxamate transport system, periplasmic component [Desulfosporosinus youngiae DSM 17734]